MSKIKWPPLVAQIEKDAAIMRFNELFTIMGRLIFMVSVSIPLWVEVTEDGSLASFTKAITSNASLRRLVRVISGLLEDTREEISILENDLSKWTEGNPW